MGNKEKGANAERELLKMFSDATWRCVRVAGSGLADESPCDLIAGKNKEKKFAIECKSSKDKKKYLSPEQIEDFLIFSEIFGLKPIIAVRFNREGWFFIEPKNLERTSTALAISLKNAKKRGKRFGEFIGA